MCINVEIFPCRNKRVKLCVLSEEEEEEEEEEEGSVQTGKRVSVLINT